MTSSAKPTKKAPGGPPPPDDDDDEHEVPKARAVAVEAPRDLGKWTRLGGIASVIVAGWMFIAFANRFHFTAPVVFISLGWLAVVLGVVYLWQTGTATTLVDEAEDPAWFQPTGASDELEREKRALLKAIKEVEFDRELGKMSDADAKEMTHVYRMRAIDVLKAIDELNAGGAGSVRDQIDREVRARMAVVATADKAKAQSKKRAGKAAEKAVAKPADKPTDKTDDKVEEKADDKADHPSALEALAEKIESEKPDDKPAAGDAAKSEAS